MKPSSGWSDLDPKIPMMKIWMKVNEEDRKRAPILSLASVKGIIVSCATGKQLPGELVFAANKGNSNGQPVSSSAQEIVHRVDSLPEDLVFEVLSMVERTKTLHQYKCISKSWQSMIESPSFLGAFRRHHRGGLLLSISKMDCHSGICNATVNFLYSTFVVEKPEPFFSRSMVSVSHLFQGVTNVVNGLACIYEDTRVFVCNVCTGETLRLPDSKFLPKETSGSLCFLGYDATSRVYKLLKISATDTVCSVAELELQPVDCDDMPFRRLECEILTLGRDSAWRKVSTVGAPLVRLPVRIFVFEEPLLINGVMYWIMDILVKPARIISFDLHKEEFLVVKPPQDPFIIPEKCHWSFAQLGGRLALYYCGRKLHESALLLFHRLEDDEGNSWSNHAIPIPPEFAILGWPGEVVVGNLLTGQTLFVMIEGIFAFKCREGYRPIYSYDYHQKKFETLCVGELSHLIYDSVSKIRDYSITCLEEYLEPIDVQLNRG